MLNECTKQWKLKRHGNTEFQYTVTQDKLLLSLGWKMFFFQSDQFRYIFFAKDT